MILQIFSFCDTVMIIQVITKNIFKCLDKFHDGMLCFFFLNQKTAFVRGIHFGTFLFGQIYDVLGGINEHNLSAYPSSGFWILYNFISVIIGNGKSYEFGNQYQKNTIFYVFLVLTCLLQIFILFFVLENIWKKNFQPLIFGK